MSTTPVQTHTITLDHKKASMLLELLTKAAATGPDARTLAELYAEAKSAVEFTKPANPA